MKLRRNARSVTSPKLVLLLSALWVASLSGIFVQAQVPVGTACTQPRIRRSWDAYTEDEKTLYKSALKLAMEKGYHQKFVQLHIEYNSELEAHKNCMFIYWHRVYLLGYENMLRSLGAEYSCVTLPVMDHLAASARFVSAACTDMESCAPIISDFGGSKGSNRATKLLVYNVTIATGTNVTCVNQGVAYSFCGNNTPCAHCITRGNAYQQPYPGGASFASVYNQVFQATSWATFTNSVETGVHNIVHSVLSGVMAYLQSPIDPLFYAHHSFIDAVQTVYLKCQLGNASTLLTAAQKVQNPTFWSNCTRRSKGSFNSADEVYMALFNYANKTVNVRKDPNNLLYPFFKDLPLKFAEVVDAKDLGVYSYTYELSGALQNMYTNCKASNTITSALLAADDDSDAGVATPPSPEENKARRWTIALYESARLNGYTEDAAREQMEMIACMHRHECLGEAPDYTALFRKNFGVEGHPRCFTLVKAIRNDEKIIGVPGWRKITSRFFPCPKKPSKTSKKK